MTKDTHDLKRIAQRVKMRRLARRDLQALRRAIRALEAGKAADRTDRRALRNLAVAATQLRDLAGRTGAEPLDPATLKRIPPHVRKRVGQRLANVARRTAAAPSDPAFRCVTGYRRCCRGARAQLWCQLALVVCLLRALRPAVAAARRR